MGFKEDLDREKHALISGKRPYETVAFLVFVVLFIQQFGILIVKILKFIKDSKGVAVGWFSTAGLTTPAFFTRIIALDNSTFMYLYIALAALALWYFLIYLLVWKYCKKNNKAKWTWTLLIVFGPSILFMPPYIFYAIYVFRTYFYRFFKTLVEEYKAFDPKELDAMDAAILLEEENAALEREKDREEKAKQKDIEKQEKEKTKEIEKEEKEEKIEEKA